MCQEVLCCICKLQRGWAARQLSPSSQHLADACPSPLDNHCWVPMWSTPSECCNLTFTSVIEYRWLRCTTCWNAASKSHLLLETLTKATSTVLPEPTSLRLPTAHVPPHTALSGPQTAFQFVTPHQLLRSLLLGTQGWCQVAGVTEA